MAEQQAAQPLTRMFTNTGCEVATESTKTGLIVTTPSGAKLELVYLGLGIDDGDTAFHLVGQVKEAERVDARGLVDEPPMVIRLYWDREACPDVPAE